LKRGQAVCLQLPTDRDADFEFRLYRLLTGQRSKSGLRLFGKATWALGSMDRPGLNRWWHRFCARFVPSPRIEAWLQHHGRMSRSQALSIRTRLQLQSNCRMNRLSGLPKMLLGLEAAFASRAEIIIASLTADPVRREAALAIVSARLDQQAVIYLTYPYWHQWRLHPAECVAGVPCFSLKATDGAQLKTSA
jgi:hypothetical protein